jgi:cytidylate kinase
MREEKIRRLVADGKNESDAALIEAVDRERSAFVKYYFGVDGPTRSTYDLMINTAVERTMRARQSSMPCIACNKQGGSR